MGSSPSGGSAPTVLMPSPTAPQLYQSVAPLESFKQLGEQFGRFQKETAKIQEQRYQDTGTPAEVGVRMAGRRIEEEAAKAAALPSGDKYIQETTGQSDPYGIARSVAQGAVDRAKQEYQTALGRQYEKPAPTIDKTPSWAKTTVMPKGWKEDIENVS